MPATIRSLCDFLEDFAPTDLAEDWDNVGLLVGDPQRPVERLMTCLTVTPASAEEAIQKKADLIVTHHPLPFHAVKRLTTETTTGRILLDLIRANVAVYSPHTAFDSTTAGINQQLAEGLHLSEIRPLDFDPQAPSETGIGRCGLLPTNLSLADVASQLKAFLTIESIQAVGDPNKPIQKIAVGCGSAGHLLSLARCRGCDLFITGETTFHNCLEAEATGLSLLLVGHYHSERFGLEELAKLLAKTFTTIEVWPSTAESSPLRRL